MLLSQKDQQILEDVFFFAIANHEQRIYAQYKEKQNVKITDQVKSLNYQLAVPVRFEKEPLH